MNRLRLSTPAYNEKEGEKTGEKLHKLPCLIFSHWYQKETFLDWDLYTERFMSGFSKIFKKSLFGVLLLKQLWKGKLKHHDFDAEQLLHSSNPNLEIWEHTATPGKTLVLDVSKQERWNSLPEKGSCNTTPQSPEQTGGEYQQLLSLIPLIRADGHCHYLITAN